MTSKPPHNLQADLTAELLTEAARPAPLPSAAAWPPLPELPVTAGTPAVAFTLTPLRWSRPCVAAAERGTGVAVRLGPWQVEVAF